jgi:CRISPR-associated protein Cmr1
MPRQMLEVRLETITPLFLGGADQQPELRPAAFRGVLRFWLRALLGAHTGDDLKRLHEEESKVFGSTAGASPVVVRTGQLAPNQIEEIDEPAPRRSQINHAYLLYGLHKRERDNQQRPRLKYRKSVKVNEPLELRLSSRPGVESNAAFKSACAALWLLTHLGGLGSRPRRGAGAIQATPSYTGWPDDDFPTLEITAENPLALLENLQTGIGQLRRSLGLGEYASFSNLPEFDVLHPCYTQILLTGKLWSDWRQAMSDFASAMGRFRFQHHPDYSKVKAVAGGRSSSFEAQRAAFGLPLPFFFSSLEGDKRKVVVESVNHDRRASPLMLRVVRYANNQGYGLVLIYFKATLVPDSELKAMQDKGRGDKQEVGRSPVPSLGLIDTFLGEIRTRGSQFHIDPMLEVAL